MNVISIIDILSSVLFAAALFLSFKIRKESVDVQSKRFLYLFLGIYVFVGISNVLEHGQITDYLDRYEDYAEIIFIPAFLFFIYSYSMKQEMNMRAKTEAKMHEQYRFVQTLLHTVPNPIFYKDTDGRYIGCNRAFEQFFGMPKEALIGRTVYDMGPKQIADKYFEKDNELFQQPGTQVYEGKVKDKNGVLKEVIFNKATFNDESGNIAGLIGVIADITKRKQMEQSVKESEERFRSLFDNASVGIALVDRDGYVLMANDADCNFLGYPREELVGMHLSEFTYPGDLQVDRELYESLMKRENSSYAIDKRYVRKDGTVVWGRLSVSLIRDEEDRPKYTAIICKDITEQRKGEEALIKAKEQYEKVVEDLPDLICRYKQDTIITFVNEAYANYFGKSRDELIGTSFLQLVPPESHKYIRTRISSLSEISPVTSMEHEAIAPDGKLRWQLWRDRALFDSSGNVVEIQSIGQDITERKEAEKKLQESRAFLQTVIDSVAEPIMVIGTDFKVVMMNRAACEFSGGDKKELPFCYEVFHKEDQQCKDKGIVCPLEEVRKTGSEVTIVHEHIRHDGEKRLVEIIASPLRNLNGSLQGIIESQRDITEKKRTEEELTKAQKIESIGVLAGGLAHDFNNLLTAILGNVSLTKIDIDPEDKKYRLLTEAEVASLRAKDLTTQLLTFSKGGEPIMRLTTVAELVRDSVLFSLSGSNIHCDFFIPHDLWPVKVDEGQIRQVIHNIVLNAKEAMPEGGMVTIRAENRIIRRENEIPLPEGEYITIAIQDSGRGIPEKIVTKIFDPYFSTKEMGVQKGVGLGLAICYSIIKNHKGCITVTSTAGIGSTFHIYLPAYPDEAPLYTDIQEGRLLKERDKGNLERLMAKENGEKKVKILIMDDEELLREFLVNVLHELGYSVEYSVDGTEAVELYRKAYESGKPFGAVILDLTVRGGMGGKETIKRLIEIDPEVKAIISSGYSDNPVMADCKKFGFSGMLKKPFTSEDLEKTLHAILGNSE